jgi:dinuclear metal center YbgI/SA1388 family protein
MKSASLLIKLSHYYPKRLAESYDHPGLQLGHLPLEVHKIMLCLDFDDEIYDFALKQKPDLIITHHPFIFGSKYQVLSHDSVKKSLYERMEKAGIPILSYHTNFDAGNPGMNDALTEELGLIDVKPLLEAPMARGGHLPQKMEVHDFARFAKEKLGVSYGLLIAAGKKMVSSVAIIGGGGWSENEIAQKEGYDIYISGDTPHHARREIVLRHYDYLDLPHEIEHVFMSRMKRTLLTIDSSLDIVTIDHEKLPEVI